MREHKYKAWDTVKKVMYSAEELGQDQETLSADGRGFVNVHGASTRLSQFHSHLLPLEYTGLKDKNEKEIYEGDIIRSVLPGNPELVKNFVIKWEYNETSGDIGFNVLLRAENREVIGNIHENPELLESK